MNTEAIYPILTEAFNASGYVHRAGSGDVQAIETVMNSIRHRDEDEQILILSGAIAGAALIDVDSAQYWAEKLISGEPAGSCEYCGEWATESFEFDDHSLWFCDNHYTEARAALDAEVAS